MVRDDASGEDDQWQRFVTFWRGVRVNVVANLVAAAILYPIGVLFGLLPKNRAAVLTAGLFLLLALMVMLFAVSRLRRVTYRLRERAWLAAWLVGVAGLGVGAYVTPESPERVYFALAAVSFLVIWIGVVREYRRGVPIHVIMSKNPRKPDSTIVQREAPASQQEIAVGDRWRSWRTARVADQMN